MTFRRNYCLLGCLVLGNMMLPLAVGSEPTASSSAEVTTTESAPSEAEIKQWIEQLDSDKFLVRESATQKLTTAKANSIPMLIESIRTASSLEKAFRCIHVLRNFAAGHDINMEKQATAELVEISETQNDRVAGYAKEVLKRIAPIKQERAIRMLSGLGIRFSSYSAQPSGFQAQIMSGPGIIIDSSYQGNVDDLYYLRHLQFIEDVQISNDKVTADWFAQIAKMPNVRLMTIKDGPVNVAMLRELEPILPKLDAIRLYYIDVNVEVAPLAAKLDNATYVEFYGLPLSEADERQITQVLPPTAQANVKFRSGGFLGVSGSGSGMTGTCYIQNVHQDSGAYKAGLRGGDTVIEAVGTTVESFQHLINLLKDKKVGETIDLKVNRHGRTLKMSVTLGKWPMRPDYGP